MMRMEKKTIKNITINPDRCNGCRACEIACAAFHSSPRYTAFNPNRSRIRMVINEQNDEWVAIRSGSFSRTQCKGRSKYIISGKEYSECSFCSTICAYRDEFKEPDSDLPLKCDMCGNDPGQVPMCVQICSRDALTYSTRDVAVREDDEVNWEKMEAGLAALSEKHGIKTLTDAVARLANKPGG